MIGATRSHNALRSAVRNAWPEISARARTNRNAYVPESPKLLGSSHKVELGARLGVRSAVLYLAPSVASGRDVCPNATTGCATTCLGEHSGQLALPHAARSQLWKTTLFFGWRPMFLALLSREVATLAKRAGKEGTIPAVRCDGSSDTGIGSRIASEFPHVQCWDYTKNVARALRHANGLYAPNYHVTFSRSGENESDCLRVLRAGGSVAVVFDTPRGAPLPKTWRRWRVIDGDRSDARFLDRQTFGVPAGHVVGLRFKSETFGNVDRDASLRRSGSFVVRVAE